MVGRQHADAKVIVLAILGRNFDPTILRPPSFGDVEPRENLDSRENSPKEPAWRTVPNHQTAVDSVAHPNLILKWLDVDVTRLEIDRFGDDQVDQFDNRRG